MLSSSNAKIHPSLSLLIHSLGTYNETSTQWWYEDTDYDEPTDSELGVTDELQSRFASFAKTGRPNNNVYTGWPEVPFTGANSNGAATRVSQFFFPLNQGGYVQNSASLLAAGAPVDRCSAFPNFRPFSVITESPSYAPTTPFPSRRPTTRRPTRHPTR